MSEGLTAQDEVDLALLGNADELESKRTLLEVWDKVLGDIESARTDRVTPQMALKLVTSWSMLSFSDIESYFDLYHDYLIEFRQDLRTVIAENPDALKNVEDDAEENRALYLDLLTRWHLTNRRLENGWNVYDELAHVSIPAIADATNFFLGQMGLVAHLDRIGLEITTEEQMAIVEALKDAS